MEDHEFHMRMCTIKYVRALLPTTIPAHTSSGGTQSHLRGRQRRDIQATTKVAWERLDMFKTNLKIMRNVLLTGYCPLSIPST